MPIPATSIQYAEISLRGLIDAGGSSSVNTDLVFHYKRASTAVNASKSALDTAFQAAVGVPIAAALNARWTQTANHIRFIDDALDQYVPFTHAVPGAIAGDSLSAHEAAFILLRTGFRGRSYKGGKHLGPFSESDVTAGGDDVFNAGAIARLTTVMTAMAAPIVDASPNTWSLQVLTRKFSVLDSNPTTVQAWPVTTILLNKRVGTMNRRKAASVY